MQLARLLGQKEDDDHEQQRTLGILCQESEKQVPVISEIVVQVQLIVRKKNIKFGPKMTSRNKSIFKFSSMNVKNASMKSLLS